jgi:hypothetical protein
MGKYNLEKKLRRELRVLNEQIDEKIIRGLSYSREAKRHRFIVGTLNRVRSRERSWLSRSLSHSFGFSII